MREFIKLQNLIYMCDPILHNNLLKLYAIAWGNRREKLIEYNWGKRFVLKDIQITRKPQIKHILYTCAIYCITVNYNSKKKSFRQFFFHDAKIGLAIFDILNHCIMIVYGSITKLVNYTSLICIHTKNLSSNFFSLLTLKR